MKTTFTNATLFAQLPPIELSVEGKPFEIPIEGAIGLLVLGDIGIIAWRQAQARAKQRSAQTPLLNHHKPNHV